MARRGNGEGSIRRRSDGRWEGSVTVGTTANGNPKRRYTYAKTRKEAKTKLNELIYKLAQGTLSQPNTITVAEWLEQWIDGKTNVMEGTRQKYRYEIRPLKESIGDMKLQAVKPLHVRQTYTQFTEKGFSVRAQKKAATHLRAALSEAARLEIMTRNPADGIKLSTPRVGRVAKALSANEVALFLELSEHDPCYPIFYLMLTLGLRRGEALGLEWRHINFDESTIRIEQSLALEGKGNKAVLKEVKTEKSRRTLYMSHDVLILLKTHQDKSGRTKGLVFTTSVGTPIHPRNLFRSFKRLISDINPTYRLHDLRHTYISLALQRGVPPEVVSERAGHARVSFTLEVYRHLYEPERRAAALSLSDLLTGRVRDIN